ncbi:class I SAM-dependent DNA methyltransferase [Oscillospiraceae bacterium LTW-04]|nr:methyltransferase domain-containing protein [Oscillospiraceae bacterium MB24-C1]
MASYNAFAPFYDRFIKPVDYKKRAAYFNSIIAPHIGEQKLLLDLACGTGSLSIALSQLGYEVIAVDASPQMLSLAQQKAYDAGEQILFLNQRMETLDLYGTIDACVCALDSLNHLTDPRALRHALSRVSLFLAPGGVFVFDMNTPYKHSHLLADNCYVYEEGDTVCVWRNKTDETLLTEISLDFFTRETDGRYTRAGESFCERGYALEQITDMLTNCGLTLTALYADDGFDAPNNTSERYIFVTKKGK